MLFPKPKGDVGLYPTSKFALVEEILDVKVEALRGHKSNHGHGGHETCVRKVNLVHPGKSRIILLHGGESQIWKGVWHHGHRGHL